MMQPHALNTEIWHSRWQALQAAIGDQLQLMRDNDDSVARQTTLRSVLAGLRAFGKSQFEFFLAGFGPSAKVRLEPSTVYPAEYALRATIDQIAYDLDMIQHAAHQRLPAMASQSMRDTLALADRLAYQALQPAMTANLLEPTTVVTYFQKAVNVRILPYAPVAFVGLPLSAVTTRRDLLAIPHEIGHYVYRHGRLRHGTASGAPAGTRFDAAFTSALANQPAWCVNWLEEIFADVYGAIIGGPVMALGFEELVTDDPVKEFIEDDGEHPVAALRPTLYHNVLRQRGGFERVTTLLEERWKQWQQQRGAPTSFKPADSNEEVSLEKGQATINTVIQSMLETDLGKLNVPKPWSGEVAAPADEEQLYTQYRKAVDELAADHTFRVPDLQMTNPGDKGTWMRLKTGDPHADGQMTERKVGDTGLWIDAVKEAAASGQSFNMPPAAWMALLDGSGWATEGPGSNAH
ncbi:MAG: hypothetical protein R3C14_04270 [Caldilineaceae bacterium]